MDSLKGLINDVPGWVERLGELGAKVDERQVGLATLAEGDGDHSPSSSLPSAKRRRSIRAPKPAQHGPTSPPSDDRAAAGEATAPEAGANPPTGPAAITASDPTTATESNPIAIASNPTNVIPSDPTTAIASNPTTIVPSNPAIVPSNPTNEPKPAPPRPGSIRSIRQHTSKAASVARKRVRNIVQKRHKTESMMSGTAEEEAPASASRTMVVVYYDSYVQGFFEELVKFVSASRNMMRKAKMAAKVAQIKRLAELEMPEDGDDDTELKPGDHLVAARRQAAPRPDGGEGIKLHYMSARNMGPATRVAPGEAPPKRAGPLSYMPPSLQDGLGLFNEGGGDVFDELDRGLELVQSLCERAAHQFLRDGDCGNDIKKIIEQLRATKAGADREMARINKEKTGGGGGGGNGGLNAPEPELVKRRSYRPMSMRRDPGAFNPSKAKPRVYRLDLEDEGVQDVH